MVVFFRGFFRLLQAGACNLQVMKSKNRKAASAACNFCYF